MTQRRSKPRRIVTRLLVFLLLGAIVNVGVAWGLAYWVLMQERPSKTETVAHPNQPGGRLWTVFLNEGFGSSRIAAVSNLKSNGKHSGIIPSWSVLNEMMERLAAEARAGASAAPNSVPPVFPVKVQDEARGWPMLSLHWQHDLGLTTAAPTQGSVLNGIEFPPRTVMFDAITYTEARALPLRPIWIGFAMNTVFYAAILWMLWAAPGMLRRGLRAKRGLCINCGYDLRGSPGDSPKCPECGGAIGQSRARQ